ncbi:hypothetical protein COL154_008411 [Colletotrichum chrysophilum]|uniref:Pyrophosphatase ppax n=1 Tax=Colletotrichum chrysophilum TaxID=1836956 RepID=A0AAD9AJF5_9PEZI|nr:uncharacterized protein COL26b_007067 [Colletotrichum chrysophilum]KAJ0346276.1 hypothetical protein KNSL1_007631 [Colletotrichum chrysophilum]KAJ0359267.1 hypothetical protein COL154_008411 [Colletotrichum chrysophilum]KAJ0374744.1 hypothetical protein COL26b_007067 [Colletotrichum chrysophilum]KAK1848035.1 pyrophosphatase ppax [Colletotrichum chrysophilum]
MTATSLVIFDLDGTLFDPYASIEETIKLTFSSFLPSTPSPAPAHNRWIAEYRRLYAQEHSQSLIRAFPGADQVLEHLRQRKVPVAIISNNGVQAVRGALRNDGLDVYVLEDLIVGDETPGATRKPDVGSLTDVLVPKMRDAGLADAVVDASEVVVVGDTVADIQFTRNVGATACWARYGYGERVQCEELRPDFTIDKLIDVMTII